MSKRDENTPASQDGELTLAVVTAIENALNGLTMGDYTLNWIAAKDTLASTIVAQEAIKAYEGAIVRRLGEHHEIAHDGFAGIVIGQYTTLEGKRGVVMQQDGTRVVHVYGEKWL